MQTNSISDNFDCIYENIFLSFKNHYFTSVYFYKSKKNGIYIAILKAVVEWTIWKSSSEFPVPDTGDLISEQEDKINNVAITGQTIYTK